MKLSARAAGSELMDEPELDPEDLAAALRDLRGVNRWLGGWRVLRRCMAALLARLPPGHYRVLDVGTGSADLPLRLASWARHRGKHLDILATDVHPQTVELARVNTGGAPDVKVEAADALALPYSDGEFDFALCSTALHHFEEQDAVQALREMNRVARYGMVINDLRRSGLALLGARLLAATAWRGSRFTRHDGPLSVRRAFTAAELRRLARAARLPNACVRTHLPFRLSLVVDRTPGRPGTP
ncbi:hypothetical protein BH23GEM3_BH23GEM3_06390 [soil metagenome]